MKSETMRRHYSPFDKLIIEADRALRTVSGNGMPKQRPSPAADIEEADLSEKEKKHSAGLMRVNHTGEVCAQALYQGQGLTAKLPTIRAGMEHAASEEVDHLAWCGERLQQLGSRPSYLNPLWYGLSFAMGAAAGAVSDKISLGFVAATEEQVCEHLKSHRQQLPSNDRKSCRIIEQMLTDERKHAHTAKAAGGADFPQSVKRGMGLLSKVMTKTTYFV